MQREYAFLNGTIGGDVEEANPAENEEGGGDSAATSNTSLIDLE